MSAELDEPVDTEVDGGLGRSTSICPVERRLLTGKELRDMTQKTAYDRQDYALPLSIVRSRGSANDLLVSSIENETTHHGSLFCVGTERTGVSEIG